MIFSSGSFLFFFIVLMLFYINLKNHQQRAALLLSASLIFYASWKPVYLVLFLALLSINYFFYSLLLSNKSRSLLLTCIIVNLSVLGFFKYLDFSLETGFQIIQILNPETSLKGIGFIEMALPLGISFFTFQMLSALIDVYRGIWNQKLSFFHWCLYVSFFPQLIAGPIVRAHMLVKQLEQLEEIRIENVKAGAWIFLGGIIKKSMLADNLAPIVEILYAQPSHIGFSLSWIATIAFGAQIYFDFSGYSEMAIGLARIFGVNLPKNFLCPYHSRNISEFWRNWHITLSQWLKDYLYIPLGGSKGNFYNTSKNLLVTMLLGGLWHGAGWTFVFWGFLHGVFLSVHHQFRIFCKNNNLANSKVFAAMFSFGKVPLTLFCITLAWVFFRAEALSDAIMMTLHMLGLGEFSAPVVNIRLYQKGIVLFSLFVIYIEPTIIHAFQKRGIDWWWKLPFVARGGGYTLVILVLLIFGGDSQKFIYFDF